MSCFDLAGHAINFLSAVEHAVFGENLVDDGSSTRGASLTGDVVKIACRQRPHAVRHTGFLVGLETLGLNELSLESDGHLLANENAASL
jgi:hypothetical protein